MVEILDGAARSRMIDRVTSSNFRRVAVRILPLEKGTGKQEDLPPSTLLARVEILLNTEEPGRVDESLLVYLAGEDRPFHKISITGRVADIVEATPSSLVLPQSSDRGPLNSGRCLCRATKGIPLALTIEFVPPGFKAEISPVEGSPYMQLVRIEYIPSRHEKFSTEVHRPTVRLRAKVGNQVKRLEIPVIVRSDGGS